MEAVPLGPKRNVSTYVYTLTFIETFLNTQWRRNHGCAGCWRTPMYVLVAMFNYYNSINLYVRTARTRYWCTPIKIYLPTLLIRLCKRIWNHFYIRLDFTFMETFRHIRFYKRLRTSVRIRTL